MADFSFDELANNPLPDPLEGMRNVANVAADFYCALYAADPLGVSGGAIRTPVGNAINALSSSLCGKRSSPIPPPSVPFSGGQCPKLYNVGVIYRAAERFEPTSLTLFGVPGPITGKYIRQPSPNSGTREYGIAGTFPDGTPDRRPLYGIDPSIEQGDYLNITSVVPQDGNDNCGDPAPTFQPVVAPINNYSSPVTVNLGLGVSATVPVTIIPTVFAPSLTLRPEINVKVGDFVVNFSPGGATINIQNNTGGPVITPKRDTDPRPDPPDPVPPSGDGGGGGECPDPCPDPCDDTAVLEKLDDIEDLVKEVGKCACPKQYEIEQFDGLPANNASFPIPPRTISVSLYVTDKSTKIRGEWGGGNAPDVEFMGWYAWRVDGVPSDRKPISYMQNTFIAPPGAGGFTFTLRNGSKAFPRVRHEVELVPQ